MRRHRARKPTRPLRHGLRAAVALIVLFVVVTWLFAGPANLSRLDVWLNDRAHQPEWRDVLINIDRVGQRAVCLPVLGAAAAYAAWRHRTLRPVLLATITALSVNLLVLVLKLWLGRGAPYDGQFSFFADGQMYPSGHAANIVSMYGLAAYLLCHYGRVTQRGRTWMTVGVAVLIVVMTGTSMALEFHWFGDLVAGYIVGGIVLVIVAGMDAAVVFRSHRLVVAPPVDPADVLSPEEIHELDHWRPPRPATDT